MSKTVCLILLFAFATVKAQAGTPVPDPEGYCKGSSDTDLFAITGICDRFYRCVHGTLYEHTCRTGLVFNQEAMVCDWPANVPPPCGAKSPSTTTVRYDGPYDTPIPDPEGHCVGRYNSLQFALPDVCEKFYRCVSGVLYENNCPDGLVFNPAIYVCDWPRNVPGC
ncbi:peritrophin-1-like [Clavelina lepadiformis]|uniref:peritrophin-1-like n=1 Tax=Clavelina lepadiformis TaxID=159417 RepID=UPI0040414C6E